MVVEYIRYVIAPERAADFEAAYQEAGQQLQASPHCLGYELTRCTEEPQRYMLRIIWDSLEGHLQGFRKDPQFALFFRSVQPFVGQIEEMQHYELTECVYMQ